MNDGNPAGDGQQAAYAGNLEPAPQLDPGYGYEPEDDYYDDEGYYPEEGYAEEDYGPDLTGGLSAEEFDQTLDQIESQYPALKDEATAEAFMEWAEDRAFDVTGDEAQASALATNPLFLQQLLAGTGDELTQPTGPEGREAAAIDAYLAEKQRRREAF
jgi:hypothetical protein